MPSSQTANPNKTTTSTTITSNSSTSASTTNNKNVVKTTSAANNNTNTNNIDMSTKIGGRTFYPALPVVDGSYPTSKENGFQQTLDMYIADNIPLESISGIQKRERVLNSMKDLCKQWIQNVAIHKKLSNDVIDNANGQLYTSGSYRLGVHEPGADIDTILVAPNFCKRTDFFGTIYSSSNLDNDDDDNNKDETNQQQQQKQRDPNSLAERIRSHPDVTNFVPVEGAAVPLLTFDWEGINIDLLFARLNSNTVPIDFDIDNDAVLDGADSATEKSLNGPRVTNLIAAIVSGTSTRYQTFLSVVRCIRKWAKTRGLYSNKMGYWGGVNINIGVALAIQLFPNACPAILIRKFFLIFKTWRWPQPVMLTKIHDAGYGLPVWSPIHNTTAGAGATGNKAHSSSVAPMITPAYPAMNSTLSVSRQTLQILQEEFNRAHDIIDSIWKEYNTYTNTNTEIDTLEFANKWKRLFEPSDFFIAYPRYLSLCIVAPTQTDAQSWTGFVESRLRKLVSDLLSRSLPIKKIQLWPKKFEFCIADKNALLTHAQRQNCVTYFIGFQIDKLRMRGEQLNVEIPLQNFREWDLSRFQPFVPGMDILVKAFRVKTLPKICFDNIYENGKIEAMKKLRQIRDADPIRQEKKRTARLEALKAKMAELQKKKQEALQQEEEEELEKKKRKREEEQEDEEVIDDEEIRKAIKKEESVVGTEANMDETTGAVLVESEETDLLESALDTFQDTDLGDAKTREQAEIDRQKLLAGELNDQGEGDIIDPAAYESDDEENAVGYTGDGARQVYYNKMKKNEMMITDGTTDNNNLNDGISSGPEQHKDKRSLPISSDVADMLHQLGYHFICDEEMKVIGTNMVRSPWKTQSNSIESDSNNENNLSKKRIVRIKFLEKFDIVELDANGHVIDKGDDDFIPSKSFVGSKNGFEFKMGLRGLGYYRTGKEVVIPANTAY